MLSGHLGGPSEYPFQQLLEAELALAEVNSLAPLGFAFCSRQQRRKLEFYLKPVSKKLGGFTVQRPTTTCLAFCEVNSQHR